MTANATVFEGLFIQTPGHGYLRVKRADVAAVGITPSSYSPSDDAFFFLEEDCDANEFLDSVTDAGFGFRMNHTNAPMWEEYIESLW